MASDMLSPLVNAQYSVTHRTLGITGSARKQHKEVTWSSSSTTTSVSLLFLKSILVILGLVTYKTDEKKNIYFRTDFE